MSWLLHKQCCDEHWGTHVSFPSGFLSVYAQQWDCWIIRQAFLSLLAILWNSVFRCLYLPFSPLLFTSLLFTVFVRPLQTAILLFCISFHGDGLDPCLLYNVTNLMKGPAFTEYFLTLFVRVCAQLRKPYISS